MAAPALKDAPLVDDAKPDIAAGNVIDAISRLGDRAALLRRLESDDAASRGKFQEHASKAWQAFNVLRDAYQELPADKRDMAALDNLIDRQGAVADMKRATHDAILDMVRELIPTVVKTTGQPEDWVKRTLEFVTFPARREAQLAIDLHFEMEAMAAEMDPEAGAVGDVIQDGDDVTAWLKRALAD